MLCKFYYELMKDKWKTEQHRQRRLAKARLKEERIKQRAEPDTNEPLDVLRSQLGIYGTDPKTKNTENANDPL